MRAPSGAGPPPRTRLKVRAYPARSSARSWVASTRPPLSAPAQGTASARSSSMGEAGTDVRASRLRRLSSLSGSKRVRRACHSRSRASASRRPARAAAGSSSSTRTATWPPKRSSRSSWCVSVVMTGSWSRAPRTSARPGCRPRRRRPARRRTAVVEPAAVLAGGAGAARAAGGDGRARRARPGPRRGRAGPARSRRSRRPGTRPRRRRHPPAPAGHPVGDGGDGGGTSMAPPHPTRRKAGPKPT